MGRNRLRLLYPTPGLARYSPLTLTLSTQAGRGGEVGAAGVLLPACGEKVVGRSDEGRT
ncbi:hypothetical protein GGE07_000297 [Sinorhizobium terangae]|nr:hypothetical protein [Sinorhizobium terangae]